MKRGAFLIEPSEFGLFLKEKRMAIGLNQSDLANAIGKSTQYISNIEKGKNNSPPNEKDIEKLIEVLTLKGNEIQQFKEKAAFDRNQLPKDQMNYIFEHPKIIELLNFAIKNNISNRKWAEILADLAGGN